MVILDQSYVRVHKISLEHISAQVHKVTWENRSVHAHLKIKFCTSA